MCDFILALKLIKNKFMNSFKIFALITVFTLIVSCDSKPNNKVISKVSYRTIPEKVAFYYGISQFEKIKTIEFNFNVEKSNRHNIRHWKWNPKTNDVSLFLDNKTIEFVHNNCKSNEEIELDKKFTNDSYWLLFPYHLFWDKDNYEYNISQNIISPLLKKKSTKMIVSYINGDGYTPNDIYELYLNESNEIIEWIYRKNGSINPTKMTTWENIVDIKGVKMSILHNSRTANFKLWFDSINIEY